MLDRQSLVIGLAAVVAAACAAATQGPRRTTSRSSLAAEEIRASGATTAIDAVTRLRPEWLRQRGPTTLGNVTMNPLVVYLDGSRFGGLEMLRTVRAEDVASMEFLDGPDASIRYGPGHSGGAILVRTRR